MVKDPDTGKRVSRPNAKGGWQTVDVPDLAIVSLELFDAAHARKRRIQSLIQAISADHGTCWRRLLGAVLAEREYHQKAWTSPAYSHPLFGRDGSGTCPDAQTFYLDTVEAAVPNGLAGWLRHPEVIAQYVQTYHEERKRLAADFDAGAFAWSNGLENYLGRSSGWSMPLPRAMATRQWWGRNQRRSTRT